VAIRYDFPRVNLIPDNAHADRTFFDMLTMSSQEVANFLSKSVNLRSVIRSSPAEALEGQDLSVTVVYDTDCNFFNALNRWKKYGGRLGSLLHIVSPPYALREYFAANYTDRRLHLRNNEFNALISSRMGTCVSRMAALLISLLAGGFSGGKGAAPTEGTVEGTTAPAEPETTEATQPATQPPETETEDNFWEDSFGDGIELPVDEWD
jgi:hypothetical protein